MEWMGLAGWLVHWDRAAFLAFNQAVHSPTLDWIVPLITDFGLGWLQACIVLALAVGIGIAKREFAGSVWKSVAAMVYRRRAWVSPLLLAFAISGIASTVIKNSFERDRPWWFYEKEHRAHRDESISVRTVRGVYALKVRGFPSGHTATTFAMATAVTMLFGLRRRFWMGTVAAWLLSVIIAFTRIYLASHWPLDLVGGAIIGILSGIAAVDICRRFAKRVEPKAAGTVADSPAGSN